MPPRINQKIGVNQETTITIPNVEYISTDKRMWNSIKRRIKIADKIFDIKEIVLIFIWSVLWWWISYFSVDEKIKPEYYKWLIIFSVFAIVVFCIYFWLKKEKKDFTNTVLADMDDIESEC